MVVDLNEDDDIWTVDDVMKYYGDIIPNKAIANTLMRMIHTRTSRWNTRSLTYRMRELRNMLKYELAFSDLHYTARYERCKDEPKRRD